jgi:adenylate cyclase class IV
MIETEAKIELKSHLDVDRIYRAIGMPKWNVQKNFIYDFQEGFLRIRYENNKAFITGKGRSIDGEFNKRPEIECEIPTEFFMAFSKLRNFLGKPFYYEKSRASSNFNGCVICLDNLKGRYFVEIEGEDESIKRNLHVLGLSGMTVERRSYLEILKHEKRK